MNWHNTSQDPHYEKRKKKIPRRKTMWFSKKEKGNRTKGGTWEDVMPSCTHGGANPQQKKNLVGMESRGLVKGSEKKSHT